MSFLGCQKWGLGVHVHFCVFFKSLFACCNTWQKKKRKRTQRKGAQDVPPLSLSLSLSFSLSLGLSQCGKGCVRVGKTKPHESNTPWQDASWNNELLFCVAGVFLPSSINESCHSSSKNASCSLKVH